MNPGRCPSILVMSALALAACSLPPRAITRPDAHRPLFTPALQQGQEPGRARAGRLRAIFVTGRLVDATGTPVSYLPIRLRDQGDATSPEVMLFTGSDGQFRSTRLRPGSYEIRPPHGLWGSVTVRVPEAQPDKHDLGDIVLPSGSQRAEAAR